MFHFRGPLLWNILQAVRRVYAEAHEDDVCVGVGQRPESIVVLLTGGIPQRQLDLKYMVI